MLTTRYIIALNEISGCGASTIRQIVSESHKLNQTILSDSEFIEFVNGCISAGLKRCRLKPLSKSAFFDAISHADRLIDKSNRYGIKMVSYVDKEFPSQLHNTVNEDGKADVPLLLYYKGDLSVTEKQGIAIIGTREPTKEGIFAGEFLGEKLAEAGFNIVSGLAIGCDTAGHRGALKCVNGKTTAFLAHGLDSVYPPENEKLATEIVERGGLLMSEYPIGDNVNRYYLVARDRLQAALSAATIVIQTGIHGGTNHAANTTLVSHKPLFCVKYNDPLLMSHDKVAGNKALVEKGAKYITSSDFVDIIKQSFGTPEVVNSPIDRQPDDEPQELLLFND